MNWLERARREIGAMGAGGTANTAERHPTAVTAVLDPAVAMEPVPSFGSNGSAWRWEAADWQALHEALEERAAIMEFDGGLPREEAERAAWVTILKQHLH